MNYVERFKTKVKIEEGSCHEWVGTKFSTGYGAFWLDGQNRGAHRVAWEMKNGKIPDDLFVCHTCDNPGCINTDHMFLGTILDNNKDKLMKQRHARGETQAASKLKEEDVLAIREIYALGGITQTQLGKRFGVGHTTVSYVVNKKAWSHV